MGVRWAVSRSWAGSGGGGRDDQFQRRRDADMLPPAPDVTVKGEIAAHSLGASGGTGFRASCQLDWTHWVALLMLPLLYRDCIMYAHYARIQGVCSNAHFNACLSDNAESGCDVRGPGREAGECSHTSLYYLSELDVCTHTHTYTPLSSCPNFTLAGQ